ncbi:MAG: carboxypeptidase regulatory-like domain-containing protein, partial [Pirellulaceae bacterium]
QLLAVAQSAAERFALPTCPPLGRSAAIEVPLSLGLWRPQVILPAESDDSRWSAEAWLPLLIHEVAHIYRRDHIVGLMQRLTLALYWWNPLAWAASRELGLVREQICDDLATSGMMASDMVSGEAAPAREYAEILVDLADRVADRSADRGQYVSALAAWNGPSDDLTRRIRRLLDPRRQVVTSLGRTARVACGGFALVMLLLVLAVCVRVDHLAAQQPAESPRTEEVAQSEVREDDTGDEEVPVELLEKTILVADAEGKPIEGAEVTPHALSIQGGSSMLWTDGQKAMPSPKPQVTDAKGVAIVRYPEYALAGMQSKTQGLFCHFNHPDFASKLSELVYVAPLNPAPVTTVQLSRGAQVKLVPRLNGEVVKGGKLFADWTSRSYAPDVMATRTPEGHLQLPRVNPGTEIVRVAYISESGERYFSEAKRVELKEGETPVVEVNLEPGIVVRGKLGDTVPRPVSEGSVVAVVAEKEESTMALVWQTYAKVDPDGSFTLEPMPGGTLQVIALCDGFMARPDKLPEDATEQEIALLTKLYGRPQEFVLEDESPEITLEMTPTAAAEVRLLDPLGKPVADTRIMFSPNVVWSHGYSQLYCHPLMSSWEWLLDPDRIQQPSVDWESVPFGAETNAEGIAKFKNLPPGLQTLYFPHDQYELADKRGDLPYSITQVELVSDQKNEFSFTLQQKQDPQTSDLIPSPQETIFCGPGVSQLVKPRPQKTFKTEAAETELAGVVIDAEGNPLAGVDVDVWTWHPGNETTTDAEGRFRLTGLDRLSEVEVELSKPGYSPSLYPSQKAGTPNWTVVLTNDTYREG